MFPGAWKCSPAVCGASEDVPEAQVCVGAGWRCVVHAVLRVPAAPASPAVSSTRL